MICFLDSLHNTTYELNENTYTGVLEEAAVVSDTSSAAGRVVSSSDETSFSEGALSSATERRVNEKRCKYILNAG